VNGTENIYAIGDTCIQLKDTIFQMVTTRLRFIRDKLQ
jgi:hypothetical protein